MPEAEDTVHNSFVKLWERRANFEKLGSIKSFLYTTTGNACVDLLRRRGSADKWLNESIYLSASPDQNDPLLANTEVFEELYQQIQALPDKCRTIFELLLFKNLTPEQVAKRLNTSAGNIRQQKRIAIGLLRSAILKKGLLD